MTRRWAAPVMVAAVLAAVALSTPASAGAGELRSFDLPSPLIDTSTPGAKLPDGRVVPKVNVLLPDGYKRKTRRGYPVLYLLHGANGGTDNWLPGGWQADVVSLFAGFPGIVVMPDGGMFGMYTDWWNGGARANPAWASYHLNLLRQTVEGRYRIRSGRRWHAIAGISMGGQGTLRYAAMLPGYFGSAAGFSSALPDIQSAEMQLGVGVLGNGVTYDAIFGPPTGTYAEGNSPQVLAANLAHTRLYLTSGNGINCPEDPITGSFAADIVTERFINGQQGPFAAVARSAGADVTEVTTCGVHTFGVWDRAIPAARAWGFFDPVRERPSGWVYRTIAADGEMWGLRFHFAAPPPAVSEFRRTGRMLSATGTGSVTIQGGRGCRIAAALPFERRLPKACTRRVSSFRLDPK